MEEKEIKNKHWSEILAEKIIAEKKPPYIITSGITTSGEVHLGTVCEFLYPSTIQKQLELMGHKAEFYFIADIFDAFDAVPLPMIQFKEQLTPHLGKPLCDVPDPLKCCNSFGEHYLNELISIMEKLDVKPKIIKAIDLYKQGNMDKYALFFLENEEKAKEIVATTSMRTISPDWSPLMPVCSNCGRIATTVVTKHDKDGYDYECTKDAKYVKGCNHKGKNKISDHKYKLVWRLHWPAWQDYFNSSSEGAGVDHFTKGGSWDTAKAIHNELFKKTEPIGFKFGFVLFRGKKYSKSSGIGMGVKDLIKLMPPELIKYALLRPDLQENKDIDPTGLKLINLYDEVQAISKLGSDANTRAERKKIIALRLSTDKLKWNSNFTDILIYYQIYSNWAKVIEILKDMEGITYLAPYVEAWISKGLQPEEYKFSFKPQKIEENSSILLKFSNALDKKMSSIDVHNLVFAIAKENSLQPDQLFKTIYKALLSKENGPRAGKLISAIGIEKVKNTIKDLYEN